LIAQSKRQHSEFIETKLVLKKVLELQIYIVQELQGGITAELQNDAQDKSDKKFKCDLVKPFQSKVTLGNERPNRQSMSRMTRRLPIILNGPNTLNIKSRQHK
jgi:hypothetical protein